GRRDHPHPRRRRRRRSGAHGGHAAGARGDGRGLRPGRAAGHGTGRAPRWPATTTSSPRAIRRDRHLRPQANPQRPRGGRRRAVRRRRDPGDDHM
ncbi:MAG: hypothetical protein AVDCRST_MAG30-1135, partial [uncultured Solirubrobacteraceae bacterium]